MNTFSTKNMALIAVMTAITCILGPLAVPLPFSPVPISFTVLAVYLSAYVLGMKRGTVTYIVYLLLGGVGVPVFSGFTGGIQKLAGPTGGYLIGFIFMSLIVGWFIDHFNAKNIPAFAGMFLGTLVCYSFGTAWLAYQTQTSFIAAFGIGVIPYIPGDIIKMIIAVLIGKPVRNSLKGLN